MVCLLEKQLRTGLKEACSITTCIFINHLLRSIEQPGSRIPRLALDFDAPPTLARNVTFELARLLYEVISVCRAIHPMLDRRLSQQYTSQLWHLHRELLNWETTVIDTWRYTIQTRPTTALDRSPGCPQALLMFPNMNSMKLWRAFWAIRLEVLLSLYSLQPASADYSAIRLDMLSLVEISCSSIPDAIGSGSVINKQDTESGMKIFSTLSALRSLGIVNRVPDLPLVTRLWIIKQLESMGNHQGIGQACILSQAMKVSIQD